MKNVVLVSAAALSLAAIGETYSQTYPSKPVRMLVPFSAGSQVASVPYVLVVAPGLGAKSVRELIAMAKQKPGQFSFGSAGTGSGTHMAGEQFKFMAGINVVHIPYKGTPEALVDTMAMRIQYWLSPMGPAMSFIKEGRLLALGVSTAQRSAVLPDVPTIAEAGLTGYEFDAWFGIFAPGKTPHAVVKQVNAAVSRIINVPELKQRMQVQGVTLKSSTPEEFTKLVADDVATLSKVVKAAGIKVD